MTAGEKLEEVFSLEKGISYYYHLLCALESAGREKSDDFINIVKALSDKTEKENEIFRSLTISERNYFKECLNDKTSTNKTSQNNFGILTISRLRRRLDEISDINNSAFKNSAKKTTLKTLEAFANNFLKFADDDITGGVQNEYLSILIYRKYAFIYDNLTAVESDLIKRNFASYTTFEINDTIKTTSNDTKEETFTACTTAVIVYKAINLLLNFSKDLYIQRDKRNNMIELRTNFNQIRGYLMILPDDDFKYYYEFFLSREEVRDSLKMFDDNALQIILKDRGDNKKTKSLKKSKDN